MSVPQIVEVVIGLAVVYYILGLIVSYSTKLILDLRQTRANDLEKELKAILGDNTFGDVMNLPQIKALKTKRYWLGIFESKEPTSNDKGLTKLLVKTGVIQNEKIEKISVSTLVDAVFEIYGVAKGLDTVLKDYDTVKNATQIDDKWSQSQKDLWSIKNATQIDNNWSQSQKILWILIRPQANKTDAQVKLRDWIIKGYTDFDQLRSKTTLWLNGKLDQVAADYKFHARRWVVGLSFLLVAFSAIDTIDLAGQLGNDTNLRTIAAEKAQQYLSDPNNKGQKTPTELAPLLTDLNALSLNFKWWISLDPQGNLKGPEDLGKKVLGVTITFLAVSLGSSFWYDVLRRLKGEKSTTPEESKASAEI